MSDTPQPINRKLRRAGEASQQAYVYHAADSQNPPTPKATHITRSFTPPEPPATAGKPASTDGRTRPRMDDASTATVGDDARIVPGASPGRKAPGRIRNLPLQGTRQSPPPKQSLPKRTSPAAKAAARPRPTLRPPRRRSSRPSADAARMPRTLRASSPS